MVGGGGEARIIPHQHILFSAKLCIWIAFKCVAKKMLSCHILGFPHLIQRGYSSDLFKNTFPVFIQIEFHTKLRSLSTSKTGEILSIEADKLVTILIESTLT